MNTPIDMSEITVEQYCAECGLEIVEPEFAAYGTQGVMCDMQCVQKNAEKTGNSRWINQVNEIAELVGVRSETIH